MKDPTFTMNGPQLQWPLSDGSVTAHCVTAVRNADHFIAPTAPTIQCNAVQQRANTTQYASAQLSHP
jgi:hypothetical protein